MSKLRIEMTNGCVAVIEGDSTEIENIINKMMTESRIDTAISLSEQKPADPQKRKTRSDKGGIHDKLYRWMHITQEDALNNLKRESEEPMKMKKFCICLGFKFYQHGTSGSFDGSVHVFLRKLEKRGVNFIYHGKRRFAISRDEQLKALEVIFKR